MSDLSCKRNERAYRVRRVQITRCYIPRLSYYASQFVGAQTMPTKAPAMIFLLLLPLTARTAGLGGGPVKCDVFSSCGGGATCCPTPRGAAGECRFFYPIATLGKQLLDKIEKLV